MSNFKTLSDLFLFLDPNIVAINGIKVVHSENRLTKLKVEPFLVEICMEGTLRISIFTNLSMRWIKSAEKTL
jgi:hypothetical protein